MGDVVSLNHESKNLHFFIPCDLLCVKIMLKVAKQGKNGKEQNVKKQYFYNFTCQNIQQGQRLGNIESKSYN